MKYKNNLIAREIAAIDKELTNLEKAYDRITKEAFDLEGEAQAAKWDQAADIVADINQLRKERENLC